MFYKKAITLILIILLGNSLLFSQSIISEPFDGSYTFINTNNQRNTTERYDNFPEKMGFSGNIKSIEQRTFYVTDKFGELVKNYITSYTKQTYFSGNVTELKYQDSLMITNNDFSIEKYVYLNGEMSETINSEGTTKIYTKYDKNNYLIWSESRINSTSLGKTVYTNNKDGYITQQKSYETNGDLRVVSNTTYNKQNLITEQSTLYYGENNGFQRYTYDRKGRMTQSEFMNSEGEMMLRDVYKYDRNNKIVKISSFFFAGELGFILNNYNSYGKISEKTDYKSDGKIKTKTVFIYDKNQNVIQEILYESEYLIPIQLIENKYEYY